MAATYEFDGNGIWVAQGGNRVYIATQTRRGFAIMKKVLSDYGRLMGMYEVGNREVEVMGDKLTVSRIEPGAISTKRIVRFDLTNDTRMAIRHPDHPNELVDVWIGKNSFLFMYHFTDKVWSEAPKSTTAVTMTADDVKRAKAHAEYYRCGITVECERDKMRVEPDLDQPYGWVVFLRVPE